MRLYEINTRVHCDSFELITEAELSELSGLGFDALWMMGVWRISEGARKLSKITSEDFEGSPYAVPVYELNRELGGETSFRRLVERAHAAGLSVIVDFVSNHMSLDSPWISEHPEYFIHADTSARVQSHGEYFLHPAGEVIAYGRDPYFPPWPDTAQLNYANEALRNRMIEVLTYISGIADGVRCDMAMLVLRHYFRRQWFPLISDSSFDHMMPREFWSEAIDLVKRANPDFKFIAEAYWDTEAQLTSLGFDLCYEKKLYDALVARDLGRVMERLGRPADALENSLYFIENHDEPRAAAVFSRDDHLAAAALILSIPGSVLIHEGQMDGKRERLPVARIKPLTQESTDVELKRCYGRLLKIASDEVFKRGELRLFDPGIYGAIGLIRKDRRRVVAFLSQISDAWHRFNAPPVNITPVIRETGAAGRVRVVNLLNSESITIDEIDGAFRVEMSRLGVDDQTKFCLLEALSV